MSKNILDSPKTTIERIRIIENKPYLKKLYTDFYQIFKKESLNLPKGKKIELGSGAGFIKKIIPSVITTDIMKLPNCDMVVNAEKMPFKNSSLSAIYLLNTFHHIKNPKKALSEFQRVLKHKGKVIMIEPNNCLFSRIIYQKFHHEDFDPKAGWKINKKGNLSAANGALPWIIFVRDRKIFEGLYPKLKIEKLRTHTPFSYIISGGFKFPSLLPHQFFPIVRTLENLTSPLHSLLGMFVTIVIEKNW